MIEYGMRLGNMRENMARDGDMIRDGEGMIRGIEGHMKVCKNVGNTV
jgi:hypothetical protein